MGVLKCRGKKMMTLDPCMGVAPRPLWEVPLVVIVIFGCGN